MSFFLSTHCMSAWCVCHFFSLTWKMKFTHKYCHHLQYNWWMMMIIFFFAFCACILVKINRSLPSLEKKSKWVAKFFDLNMWETINDDIQTNKMCACTSRIYNFYWIYPRLIMMMIIDKFFFLFTVAWIFFFFVDSISNVLFPLHIVESVRFFSFFMFFFCKSKK